LIKEWTRRMAQNDVVWSLDREMGSRAFWQRRSTGSRGETLWYEFFKIL
jgi:hypothetical protein